MPVIVASHPGSRGTCDRDLQNFPAEDGPVSVARRSATEVAGFKLMGSYFSLPNKREQVDRAYNPGANQISSQVYKNLTLYKLRSGGITDEPQAPKRRVARESANVTLKS